MADQVHAAAHQGEWSGAERRSGQDRRGDGRRGPGRRRSAGGTGRFALAVLSLTATPVVARADIYTRANSRGVLEATNVPLDPREYKLAYRSKGTVIHSAEFRLRPSSNREYDEHIDAAAGVYGVGRELIRAVIQVESAFDRKAVSTAGARGLMQLMPATARRFGVRDSFDARQNIFGGTSYLRVLLDLYRGDVALASAAYNAGEGAVARYGRIPPYKETQDYVRKVAAILGSGFQVSAPATAEKPPTPPAGATAQARRATAAPVKKEPPRLLYRWTDEKGVMHLTESPPTLGQFTVIRSSAD